MNLKLFITGRPGIGKTTTLLKVYRELKRRGIKVGGFITKEVRRGGVREGFEIISLTYDLKGILASKGAVIGPKLGSYRVNLRDLNEVGVKSVRDALGNSQVIIIDEIGPMELFSEEFRKVVEDAVRSAKPLIASVHRKVVNGRWFRDLVGNYAKVITVTLNNRDKIPDVILKEILPYIKR